MTLDEREIEGLRRMTPARKLEVMTSLIRQAYELKRAGIRARFPDLPEAEVEARVRLAVGGDGPSMDGAALDAWVGRLRLEGELERAEVFPV